MSETLCLLATLAGRAVAIPADAVEAVVDLDAITPVPRAHPAVVGLAALRSRVITVVDPRPLLGAAPGEPGRAILLRHDGHEYALLVDGCADIAPLAVDPLPAGLALHPAWRALAAGMVEQDGACRLLITPAALVPQPLAA
jgi:purine-binding chemotaxis protein CheW